MESLQNALQKLRVAAGRFMLGRNGMDQLNYALLWGYLIVCVARAIALALTRSAFVGWAFDILTYIVLVVMGFRILSRNLPKRQAENMRWLDWWGRTKRITDGAIKRHRDKEHKYYTCKQCGTVCRVPTGKGNIIITCPKCGAKIQAKT